MIICEICDTRITEGTTYYEKVIGWVASKDGKRGTTVSRTGQSMGYAHKVCLEVGNQNQQAGLFG